jgi:hypothetical protein
MYIKIRFDYARVGWDREKVIEWLKNLNKTSGVYSSEVSETEKVHMHGFMHTDRTIRQIREQLKYKVGNTKENKWYSITESKEKFPKEYLCYILKGKGVGDYDVMYDTPDFEEIFPHTWDEYNEMYWVVSEKIDAKKFAKKAKTLSIPAQIAIYIDNCSQYDPKKDEDIMDACVDYTYGILKKPVQPPNMMGNYYSVKYNYRPDLIRKKYRRMVRKYDAPYGS